VEVQVLHEERYWYPDDGGQVWLAGYTPVAEDGRYLGRDAPELAARGLRVASVAGAAAHHARALAGEAAAPGRPLELRRDPANEHDPNAIMVLAGGELIGFVPRDLAAELAPELDRGASWTAIALREQRASPRDPRTGLTMLLAPDTSVSFVTWRPTTSSRRTRPPSGST
jgi:HIRAN domain